VPRFTCTIEFALETRISPDGIRFDTSYGSEVEDFEDNSYFRDTDIEADGGSVTFIIEADSEDEAHEKAAEVINEGAEYEDDNGFTWVVASMSTEIEKIEEPMTLERAWHVIETWLAGREDDDLTEAADFLRSEFERLGGKIAELGREVAELSYKLSAADRKVAELAGDLDRLKNGPDGSEAPAA
jgi:hypothetical protein